MSDEALDHFTPSAKQALVFAREEAIRFHHNFVGAEHVLLGILKSARGVALNVLKRLRVDLEVARGKVEELVGLGSDNILANEAAFTPRVEKVLTVATKEAKALGHTYVGTEHLLLALLREETSVAVRLLKSMNVDIQKVRQEVLAEHDRLSPDRL